MGTKKAKKQADRRSTVVPEQFLGYSLQATRAVMRLLNAEPGSFVGVEILDDVSVAHKGGTRILEQTKSVRSGNPVADRSLDLWKTLFNWVSCVQSHQINLATTSFELFTSTKRSGRLIKAFAAAQTVEEAKAALAQARSRLWGEAPNFAQRKRLPETLARYVNGVLEADESIAIAIVQQLSLVCGSGSSWDDLVALLRREVISGNMVGVVAHQLLGWAKASIDSRIEAGEPPLLSTDLFDAELLAFVRKCDRFAILNSFSTAPSEATLSAELQSRTYIRQLEIVGFDYDEQLAAANDFLRATVDRSVWAEKGLVHRSSFDEYEGVLVRVWKAKKKIVQIREAKLPVEERGQLLYSECSILDQQLDGRPVPNYFVPGCYHALSDRLSVGWHPEFRAVLARRSSRKEKL